MAAAAPPSPPTAVPPLSPAPLPAASRPSPILTLDEAIAAALRQNKRLRIAAEGVKRARGREGESRAAYLPVVSSTVTFTRLDEGSSTTLTGPNGEVETIPIVLQNQRNVGIAATVPLDIAGQIRAAVGMAQFQTIAARLEYNRTRSHVVLNVKTAYYNLLRARAFLVVAEGALQNARARQTTAEAFLREEAGTRFDVLRTQTEAAGAQQDLIAARNRVEVAAAALANATGLDQEISLEVEEAAENTALPASFETARETASRTRPEVFTAEAQIAAARKGLVLARRSLLPSLGLSWNFNYAPDIGGFAPRVTGWTAVATLGIPIFEGGLSRARSQQAAADVDAAQLTREEVLENIALEVREAFLGQEEARERLAVAGTALVEATEQYRLARVRYEEGVTIRPGGSPLLEISDAQTALTRAQNNQVNARYDIQAAAARLEYALGQFAYDPADRWGLPGPGISVAPPATRTGG